MRNDGLTRLAAERVAEQRLIRLEQDPTDKQLRSAAYEDVLSEVADIGKYEGIPTDGIKARAEEILMGFQTEGGDEGNLGGILESRQLSAAYLHTQPMLLTGEKPYRMYANQEMAQARADWTMADNIHLAYSKMDTEPGWFYSPLSLQEARRQVAAGALYDPQSGKFRGLGDNVSHRAAMAHTQLVSHGFPLDEQRIADKRLVSHLFFPGGLTHDEFKSGKVKVRTGPRTSYELEYDRSGLDLLSTHIFHGKSGKEAERLFDAMVSANDPIFKDYTPEQISLARRFQIYSSEKRR